jgi:hypothetical protein
MRQSPTFWPAPLRAVRAFECRTCGLFQNGWLTHAGTRWHSRTTRPHCHRCQTSAASSVWRAIKAGVLPRADGFLCADCGRQAHGYDHRDYTKPLAVEPVCRSCNWHRGPAARVFVHGSLLPKEAA